MKAPAFWYLPESRATYSAFLLWPLSLVWSAVTARRVAKAPKVKPSVPVICVGNVTVGGTGKTPTALAIADHLKAKGARPVFLTRGFGGEEKGPLLVERQNASQVGDEPLLLARCAPTVVAQDRAQGARFIEDQTDATVIIMDDGFQNPDVEKTLSLIVVDGGVGFGNNKVIPAGPLREPVYEAVDRAEGLILVGDKADHVRLPDGLPVLNARLEPRVSEALIDSPVLAFAGIGRPQKLYDSLREVGYTLAGAIDFPDHHPFTSEDEARLLETAQRLGAKLMTTEKDAVRLSAGLREEVMTLPVDLVFEDEGLVDSLLEGVRGAG